MNLDLEGKFVSDFASEDVILAYVQDISEGKLCYKHIFHRKVVKPCRFPENIVVMFPFQCQYHSGIEPTHIQ
jgi:hypothetical protein